MEGVEENEMKQKLQDLQKQLAKKQLFKEAVPTLSSLLTLSYASASPSLQNLFYTVVCRVATILKARYTAQGFWTSGLQLLLEAEKLVAEPSQKDHLRNCIAQAKEHLSELDSQSEGVERVQNRTGEQKSPKTQQNSSKITFLSIKKDHKTMEGVEEDEMKQKLQDLQKQLAKKQLFKEAVPTISSLLTLSYASASSSLQNLFYTVVCRVATILKARYTAQGFWTSGLQLFLEAEKLVAEPSQKDHLRNCIAQAKQHLSELDSQSEDVERVQNRTGGYLFEGHFTVDPELPQPECLVQSNLLTPVANLAPLHNGAGGSGDMLLQWGHRKRSRISRSVENRSAGAATGCNGMADDSSSSSSTQLQAMMKVPRRSITLPTPATTAAGLIETKNSSNTIMMPPPTSILPDKISITTLAPANSSTCNGKVGSHKSSSKENSSFVDRRNLEDPSGVGSGSHPPRSSSSSKGVIAVASSSRSKLVKRSPQKVVEKNDQKKIGSTCATTAVCSSGSASLKKDEKRNGLVHEEQVVGFGMNHHQNNIGSALPQEAGCSNTATTINNHEDIGSSKFMAGGVAVVAVNGGGEVHEWPRVHIPLTKKEKEEDFLLMKGTKLPHRPKKRPKAVDRMLQYCFPGTWLADVTKARYEVKEKKCTTKKPKRRGLKGMENMGSDSE